MQPARQVCKYITNQEYIDVHKWVRENFGNACRCENPLCEKRNPNYQWALRRGRKYERNIKSFVQLCIRCHREYDKVVYPSVYTPKYLAAIEHIFVG